MERRFERKRQPEFLTTRAREMRREPPMPERLVWQRLRNRQLGGCYFRRQYAVGPYVLDFYCAEHKLCVELDGWSHDDTAARDAQRTKYLESRGIRVVRYSDEEALRDLDAVIYQIAAELGIEW